MPPSIKPGFQHIRLPWMKSRLIPRSHSPNEWCMDNLQRRQNRLEGAQREVSVPYLSTACAAQRPLFTRRKWREVVMQKELLRLCEPTRHRSAAHPICSQRQRVNDCVSPRVKIAAAVRSGQVINFRPNRADICRLAPVQSTFFITTNPEWLSSAQHQCTDAA